MLLAPIFRGIARQLSFVCLALATVSATRAQSFSAADGFDPNVDGVVMAVAYQPDGKVLLAGQFTSLAPNGTSVTRNNIARVNADGSLDSFDPNANGAVRAVALQLDGKIIIGGDFTTVDGKAHNYVARINADGTVDESFTGSIGTSLDKNVALPTKPQVMAVGLQHGFVVVGGTFGSASSSKVTAVQRNNLARFTTAGELDTSFDPSPNGIVLSMAPYSGDKIIIGGGFNALTPNKGTPVTRFRVARLNLDGTPDSFDPSASDGVTAIAVQADGHVLLGGYFQILRPNGADAGTPRQYLARVDATGALDNDFAPTFTGAINSVDIAKDGTIVVGGQFRQVYSAGAPSTHTYLARIFTTGEPDNSFNPNLNAAVNAVVIQPDNKILIGGTFTRADASTAGVRIVRNHVARVLPSGAIDTPFAYDAPGRVLTAVADKKGLVVAGTFTNIGGASRYYMARILADGTVDPAYYPPLNGPVYTIAYDSTTDSTIVGGQFTTVGTDASYHVRSHIARIKSDGSVDTSFDPKINGPIKAIQMLSGGAMLVGGNFTAAQPNGTDTAVTRGYMLKLNASGDVDATFNPTLNGAVLAIAPQSDGKILIGGAFTALQPGGSGAVYSRSGVARLNADGSLDQSYNPVLFAPAQVNAIAVQSDGKAVLAGQFNYVVQNNSLTSRNSLVRLNTDGSLDTSFDPNANGPIFAMALQADGKIVVGGSFTAFLPNGATTPISQYYLARIKPDGTLDTSFNLGLNQQFANRVDFLGQSNGDIYVGGTFTSAQPSGSAVLPRQHFLKINAAGTIDPNFTIHPGGAGDNVVNAISPQPDQRILVGGKFTDLNGASGSTPTSGPNLARYGAEGTPDFNFNGALSTDDAVYAMAIRPTSTPLQTQLSGFAFLNPNGTLNSSFKPNFDLQGRVNVAVQDPTTKMIYLAGVLTVTVDGAPVNLVRVSPTGQLDTTYKPTVTGSNGTILGMLIQPEDGKIVIWGSFTSINGVGESYIARLNPDGSSDPKFNPNPDGFVNSVIRLDDKTYMIGGSFSTFKPVTNGTAATDATAVPTLAHLDADGNIDAKFIPSPNGTVYSLAQDTSGRLLVAGAFTQINPAASTTIPTRNHVARLTAKDFALDSFDPNVDGTVFAVALQSTGKIIIGGQFTTVGTGTSATHRSFLARLNDDGTPDASFKTLPNSTVSFVRVEPDDSIVIGGLFTNVTDNGGITIGRNGVARLLADGSIDTAFNPALNGQITGVSILPDNSVIVGGTFISTFPSAFAVIGGKFTHVSGQPAPYLAEVNADGSFVGTFQPGPNDVVKALLPLKSGQFLVGGAFTSLAVSSKTHAGLARFTATSEIDETFIPAINGGVESLMIQSDDKILVGTGGADGLIRLNADGTRDTSFHANEPFAPAVAIAVRPDGKIIAAGPGAGISPRVLRLNTDGSTDKVLFTASGAGETISTLTLETDGGVVVAGKFAYTTGNKTFVNVLRIGADDKVDTTFNPAPDGAVNALALQADGRLLLGGSFTNVAGQMSPVIARVGTTAPTTQTLTVNADGKTVTWARTGTVGQVVEVSFEVSSDSGQTWTTPVYATQLPDGSWQQTLSTLPASGNFYIRARAIVPTSAGKSTGAYEAILLRNNATSLTNVVQVIGPVVSSVPWDQAHYQWVVDASGTIRIVDAMSLVPVSADHTVLVNGGGADTDTSNAARLANLSTRGIVSASSPLIGGFSIVGTNSRTVLIRAVGPGLTPFGVTDYLAAPQLVLNGAGHTITTKTGWDSSLSATFVRVGAFPFAAGSTDSAVVVTLSPGTYTVTVNDASGGAGGDAMIEVYDASDASDTSSRLANLSARATVTSTGSLISGMVVTGTKPKTMLVRGVGPGLAKFGVTGVLSDPVIAVYNGGGSVMGTNDNWSTTTLSTISSTSYASSVNAAAKVVNAFPLDANSTDAAVVVTLQPGAYTVQLRGADGGTGAAMIELYELP
jgi:uncharacterized delta-60 repeat protein